MSTRRILDAMKFSRNFILLLAPAIYLFVLPLAHMTAVRAVAFSISALLLLATWRCFPAPPVPLKLPFAVWLALALVSLIWAIRPGYSIGEIRLEILQGFLTFLIFFKATRSDRELDFWFLTLAASALLVGIFAFSHFLRGLNPYSVGMHGGMLYYAGYLNTIFPMLAAIAILRAGWRRIFVICLVVFLLLTAIGSKSRAVWVGFLLELVIFGILYFRNMEAKHAGRKAAVVLGLALVVLFSTAFLYIAKEKLHLSGGPIEILSQASKADQRPKLWSDSIALIRERPITGAGFGRMVLGQELVEQQKDPNHTHAHNILLNYALQLGVLGPFVLAFLFFSIVRELWKLLKSSDNVLKVLGIAGLSIVGGIFGQSMVEDIFVRHLAWLFWATLGMTLGYAMNKYRLVPGPPDQRRPVKVPESAV